MKKISLLISCLILSTLGALGMDDTNHQKEVAEFNRLTQEVAPEVDWNKSLMVEDINKLSPNQKFTLLHKVEYEVKLHELEKKRDEGAKEFDRLTREVAPEIDWHNSLMGQDINNLSPIQKFTLLPKVQHEVKIHQAQKEQK